MAEIIKKLIENPQILNPEDHTPDPKPEILKIAEKAIKISNNMGVSWPAAQALPVFSKPADILDIIEAEVLSEDEQITFSSFQGLVNRSEPRILIVEDGDVDQYIWPSTLGFEGKVYSRNIKYDLMAKYRSDIKGIVLYSTLRSVHYRNLASTIANIKGYLPVTSEVRDRLADAGISFAVSNIIDITKLDFTSSNDIYNYMYDTCWKDCTKRLIISANPEEDLVHNRDVAAAVKAAVIFCETTGEKGKAIYGKFLKDMADNGDTSISLGWFPDERSGISTASKFGIGNLTADYFISGSVYSGTNHEINIPQVPPRPALQNKVYIAVYFSDGDNIQYAQRSMRKYWDDEKSSRGKVAVNWTFAPGLTDIAPCIMNYYYSQASDKECFVAGPSGMGYIIPYNSLNQPGADKGDFLTNKKYADNYTKLTETYLQKSGLRVITIWDGANDTVRKSYEENCRSLYGITVQNFNNGGTDVEESTENNRLHFDLLSAAYTGDFGFVKNNVSNAINSWNKSSPLFLSYQFDRWIITTDQIVKFEKELRTAFPGIDIEFVRADHYFSYYNEHHKLPINLSMLSDTKITSKDRAGTEHLQFDFGKDYCINRYMIRQAKQMAGEWKVEVSSNGTSWTTVDIYRADTKNITAAVDVEIEKINARYLRVTVLDSGKISDAEIYGTE